jgi:hypothetical protein
VIAPPIERVQGTPRHPPSNRQRVSAWYAKAAQTDYPLMLGPRWDQKHREYERLQRQDAELAEPFHEC